MSEQISRLKSYLEHDGHDLSETAETWLGEIVARHVGALTEPCARLMELTSEALRSRLRTSGISVNRIIHAETVSNDEWQTFDITVNAGMMMYLHHISKVIVSQCPIASADDVEPPVTLEQAVQGLRDISTAYFDGKILEQAGIDLPSLNSMQRKLQANLLNYMEGFVIAHELGHIVFLSGRSMPAKEQVSRQLVSNLLAKDAQWPPDLRKQVLENWPEELLADQLGMKMLCQSAKGEAQTAFLGGVMFLIAVRMLEEFFQRYRYCGRSLPVDTHPPSGVRHAMLREALLRETPSGVAPLGGDVLWGLADKLIEVLAASDKTGDRTGFRQFLHACQVGDQALVVKALRDGIDPNRVDPTGDTALHIAARHSQYSVVATLLNTHEINCDALDREGSTPMHEAAGYGYLQCVDLLIEAGANPNITNKSGYTPLTRAAFYGHAEVAERLLGRGGDHGILNETGLSILATATLNVRETPELQTRGVNSAGCLQVALVLAAAGADPDLRRRDSFSARDIATRLDVKELISVFGAPGAAEPAGSQIGIWKAQ